MPSPTSQDQAAQRGQWFIYGPWTFSIDEADALITASPREPETIPVPAWAQAYGLHTIDDPDRRSFPIIGPHPDHFNREHAMTTDLTRPVLLAVLDTGRTRSVLLIDGTHRLYRAHREDRPTLPAYVLTAAETARIRHDRWLR